MTTCPDCNGAGIARRYKTPNIEYVCRACGGFGTDPAPLVGRFDGVGLYPDICASTDGMRRVLVYVQDGRRDDLPGQVNWRLVTALEKPRINRFRVSGGSKRDSKDGRGNAISRPLMARDVRISGHPVGCDANTTFPWHFSNLFEGALQLAAGFPRTSYKGKWHVSTRGKRLMFRATGIILDKVH